MQNIINAYHSFEPNCLNCLQVRFCVRSNLTTEYHRSRLSNPTQSALHYIYLPEEQLVSAYIEPVGGRIFPILPEAREDSHRITLLELCSKAKNLGENLQRKQNMPKYYRKRGEYYDKLTACWSRILPHKST